MLSSLASICIVVFAILCPSNAEHTRFKSCSDGGSAINFVDVQPCSTFPCKLAAHQNYKVAINMTLKQPVSQGKVVVQAKLIAYLPYPGYKETDFCKQLVGAACPLRAGQTVLYQSDLSIPKDVSVKILPSQLTVRWQVMDGQDNSFMCFITEINVDKNSKSKPMPIV